MPDARLAALIHERRGIVILRSSCRRSLAGISYFPQIQLHSGRKEGEGEQKHERRTIAILFAAALVALASVFGVTVCGGAAGGGGAQKKVQEAKQKVEKKIQEGKQKVEKKVQQGKQKVGKKGY